MRAFCIHDGTKKKTIHQLLLVYLANQSTLPPIRIKEYPGLTSIID
jgi:hypothetical protein